MGNFFEMVKLMKNGDVIESKDFAAGIKRQGSALYYVDKYTHEVLTSYGRGGKVVMMYNMDVYTWELSDEYIEIDLNEVKERLEKQLPVYVNKEKDKIGRYTQLQDYQNNDFEDVFLLTTYFKKRGE